MLIRHIIFKAGRWEFWGRSEVLNEFACTLEVAILFYQHVHKIIQILPHSGHIRADLVQKVANHDETAPLLGKVRTFYERRRTSALASEEMER